MTIVDGRHEVMIWFGFVPFRFVSFRLQGQGLGCPFVRVATEDSCQFRLTHGVRRATWEPKTTRYLDRFNPISSPSSDLMNTVPTVANESAYKASGDDYYCGPDML